MDLVKRVSIPNFRWFSIQWYKKGICCTSVHTFIDIGCLRIFYMKLFTRIQFLRIFVICFILISDLMHLLLSINKDDIIVDSFRF